MIDRAVTCCYTLLFLLTLLFPPQARIPGPGGSVPAAPPPGITLAATCIGTGASIQEVVTSSCVTQANDIVIVGVLSSGSGTSTTSVCNGTGLHQCTLGDTFVQQVTRSFLSGVGGFEVWSTKTAGGTFTIDVVASTSGLSIDVFVHIVRGLTSATVDKSNHATGTSATPNSGSTGTLSAANEYIFGECNHAVATFTEATGYTSSITGTQFPSQTAYKVVSATTAVQYDPGLSASVNWVSTVAAFQ